MTKRNTPVICGIGLSDNPRSPGVSSREHEVIAMNRALKDAGLTKQSIDGYAAADRHIPDSAEYLGIDYRFLDGTMVGGSSFQYHVRNAAAAIESGNANTVLISYGSDRLSSRGRSLGTGEVSAKGSLVSGSTKFEVPYGTTLVSSYAMAAKRHMHEFGTTSEQLAKIAVDIREYATLNPNAMYREPMTVDDVLSSRMIADPLHKLDCCGVTDGGAAIIMTTEERARDLPNKPTFIMSSAIGQTHWNISQMPDFSQTAAATISGELFGRAGITQDDVDMLMLYDSFTITCLLLIEGMGFSEPGEGGKLVESGAFARGGRWPLNTDGGGLSSMHPGMRGLFLIVEAVRQLRGQAGAAQVPNCEIALAAASGGWLSTIGGLLLTNRSS